MKWIVGFILLSLLQGSFVFAEADSSAQIEEKIDVKKMCALSMSGTLLEINKSTWKFPELLFSQSPEVIATAFLGFGFDPTIPWRLQDLTRPNVVRAAYLLQHHWAQKMIDRFSKGISPREVLRRAAAAPVKQYSNATLAYSETVLASVLASKPASELDLLLKNSQRLCAQFLDPKCSAAVADVLKVMDPRWVGNKYIGIGTNACCVGVSHPAILKRIWTDPDLVQGLAIYAGRLMDHVSKGKPQMGDLLTDLVDAFKSVGFSLKKSQDLARVVLGFYGTRGASIAFFEGSVTEENLPVMVAMYMLTTGIGVVDAERMATSTSYTLPKNLPSTCGMGRPYHFWMASELSLSLLDKGYSPRTSAIASHLVGKLYEFGAKVLGRDPMKIYKEPFRTPYQLGMQVGMGYKSAAVLWATGQMNENWPLDRGLERILARARPMPKLTPEQLKKGLANDLVRYVWFHRLVAPDEYLRATHKIPFAEEP
ncbi:MAG: hypothetical protein K2X47_08000 [Bdellovibrionales bacterium]|nr:hypothetical protein [Bdellovibrionales bacterium]